MLQFAQSYLKSLHGLLSVMNHSLSMLNVVSKGHYGSATGIFVANNSVNKKLVLKVGKPVRCIYFRMLIHKAKKVSAFWLRKKSIFPNYNDFLSSLIYCKCQQTTNKRCPPLKRPWNTLQWKLLNYIHSTEFISCFWLEKKKWQK